MSDSAKKKLKQMRLPFAIIISDSEKCKGSTDGENTSSSRKRKPSTDAENVKSNKIGRIADSKADSKENVAAKQEEDEVQIIDDDTEQSIDNYQEPIETAPATPVSPDSTLHIRLPNTRPTRKINSKPSSSVDGEDPDDSVVYLDNEEIRETKKTKIVKKRKQKESLNDETSRARKSLNMSGSAKMETIDHQLNKSKDDLEDKACVTEVATEPGTAEPTQDDIRKDNRAPSEEGVITSIPSNQSSPEAEDPDSIHDEIIGILSDDSDNKNETSPGGDGVDMTHTLGRRDHKNLTPKQLARRQFHENRRLEKELQRQKERELKEQQRIKEKESREEARRKEKDEKDEARKREKEERDRKRQAEQDKKDEEKRIKEEERKRAADQRDEEKRLKEEERKLQVESREEEKRKRDEAQKKKEIEVEMQKKKAAQVFSKFFVAKKKTDSTMVDDDTSKDIAEIIESPSVVKSNFMPFQIRERMKVAPCVRHQINKDQIKVLEESLKTVKPLKELYIQELKSGVHKPGVYPKTWQSEDKDDNNDVVVIDELDGAGEDILADEGKTKAKHRSKFLLFEENRRPAYHGTWRKTTKSITARRPWAKDLLLDYDVNSDDEWEEEEPGESLHGSESEKEKDKSDEEDYEVDNDFFVPHGHLSDEEIQQMDDGDNEDNHPEAQKAKLKILQQEFAAEMKKKTEKIKPRLIGCVWLNGNEDQNGCTRSGDHQIEKKYHCSDIIWRILKAREMMTSEDGVKLESNLEPAAAESEDEAEKETIPTKSQVRAKFNDESIKVLMKLVHGNVNNKRFIVREFQAYRLKKYHKAADFLEFSVKSVFDKILEISDYKTCPEEGLMFGKKCWLLKPEVMQEYFGNEVLNLPNEWNYILEKEVKEKRPRQPASGGNVKTDDSPQVEKEEVACEKANVAEKLKVLPQTPPTSSAVKKKRVQLLMSVPRGQEISQIKKNSLISQYLKGNQETTKTTLEANDVIVVLDD